MGSGWLPPNVFRFCAILKTYSGVRELWVLPGGEPFGAGGSDLDEFTRPHEIGHPNFRSVSDGTDDNQKCPQGLGVPRQELPSCLGTPLSCGPQ